MSTDDCLVMLVEDDDAIRSTFAEILESEGYSVLAFANGREALEAMDMHPCLILLDWMMPEMNGEQFLEERKMTETAREIPVVVVSATVGLEQFMPGVSALIRKPLDIDGLLSAVKKHRRPISA